MTRRVFSSMAYPSAARRRRLLVIVCALLTVSAGFDSPLLLPASSGSPPPASQNPSPSQDDGDDDDCVLDLTAKPAAGRRLRRNARPPSPIAVPKPCFSRSCQLRQPPMTPVCEHEYRNGIGTPLLC